MLSTRTLGGVVCVFVWKGRGRSGGGLAGPRRRGLCAVEDGWCVAPMDGRGADVDFMSGVVWGLAGASGSVAADRALLQAPGAVL